MSTFFEDLKKSLEEAIMIENGQIPVSEVPGMPIPTIRVTTEEKQTTTA